MLGIAIAYNVAKVVIIGGIAYYIMIFMFHQQCKISCVNTKRNNSVIVDKKEIKC